MKKGFITSGPDLGFYCLQRFIYIATSVLVLGCTYKFSFDGSSNSLDLLATESLSLYKRHH